MTRSPRARERGDEGSAIIECIVVGAMTIHSAALASTQAVREAGRAFSTASNEVQGRSRAAVAARLAFADQGLTLPPGSLGMACPDGTCLAPGSVIDITLDWRVPLPWLPASCSGRASVPMSARQRVPVDDYRSSPDGSA